MSDTVLPYRSYDFSRSGLRETHDQVRYYE